MKISQIIHNKFYFLILLVSVSFLRADTQIIEFHAKRTENNIAILEWATTEETNLKQFDIERSNDGITLCDPGVYSFRGIIRGIVEIGDEILVMTLETNTLHAF